MGNFCILEACYTETCKMQKIPPPKKKFPMGNFCILEACYIEKCKMYRSPPPKKKFSIGNFIIEDRWGNQE